MRCAPRATRHLEVTTDPAKLAEADYIVVAVPIPVDIAHNPDFTPLAGASTTVGKHMKRGAIVVFQSTVYPGATDEAWPTAASTTAWPSSWPKKPSSR